MANDAFGLLHFRQALVFSQHEGHLRLLCVSGLAMPPEDSPYRVWLKRASHWLGTQLPDAQPHWLEHNTLTPPPEITEHWAEWWPHGVWCVPLHAADGEREALLLYLLDAPPEPALRTALIGLWQTWAYCWSALGKQPRRRLRWRLTRRETLTVALLSVTLLLFPVHQTALAPAQIVSNEAEIISSPIEGVIAHMDVRPNQPVAAGAPLFELDPTTLRNHANVLTQQVAVADAELMSANQRAFDNPQSRNELTVLTGTAEQRRAELAATEAQLARTHVVAPKAGVAVFSDPDDWLGKPVVTGERILEVANPATPAMRIELPVADAIALEPGAEVTLYLSAYPLSPLHGKVLETSYQARPGEDGVIAYRLLASVEGRPQHARLGLHGTAKLYGKWVSLGYYLLRRPLAAARAWSGL